MEPEPSVMVSAPAAEFSECVADLLHGRDQQRREEDRRRFERKRVMPTAEVASAMMEERAGEAMDVSEAEREEFPLVV